MKRIALLACCFGLQWALSCPSYATDYEIGSLLPLSGPNATYGDILMAGSSLAADHINADHLVSGKLSVQYEDSQALPQPAVVGMTKLVNVDKVPYVLTSFTGASKAIAPLAMRNHVVAVNTGGVGPDLAALGEYFWNVITLANLEVKGVVPYLVNEKHVKTVILIYVDDPLGEAILDELKTELPKAGAALADTMSVPTTAQEFSGIAAKVRASHADAVYLASYGAQQNQIIKQLRDNGVTAQFVGYSGYPTPEALALPESAGLIYTTQSFDLASNDPVTQRFVKDFEAKYHHGPNTSNILAYNAVWLFGSLAHSLEKKGTAVTGENLLAERRATGTFKLVGGTLTFQQNGSVIWPIRINVVEGGAGKPVKSVDITN
jgi:branched-chain amino acid transport system substrate-binding protein